ncbi:MAG: NACHT domain-containing protein, partial [bacterium]|nr:NACHT domain-containing protein [bacterium]
MTMVTCCGVERAVGLPEVYVELDVTGTARPEEAGEERAWAWRLARGEAAERTPATAALARDGGRCFVLLGEAGSGKTTFGHHLCHTLAFGEAVHEGLAGLVPVRFVLREAAARQLPPAAERGAAGLLWDALGEDLGLALGAEGARRLRPWLEEKIRTAGALVVFDGLDEVPEAGERRQLALESIAAF